MAKVKSSDYSANSKFTIAWLDSSVNSSGENQATQQTLCDTFGTVKIFEDEIACRQFIQSKPKQPIILIVSGRLSREIVPDIDDLEHILGIYIYCMDKSRHEKWAEQFFKVSRFLLHSFPFFFFFYRSRTSLLQQMNLLTNFNPIKVSY
jgi:hypothetical protein